MAKALKPIGNNGVAGPDDVLKDCLDTLERDPHDQAYPEYRCRAVEVMARLGHAEQARGIAEWLEQQDPRLRLTHRAWSNLAMGLVGRGELDLARTAAHRAGAAIDQTDEYMRGGLLCDCLAVVGRTQHSVGLESEARQTFAEARSAADSASLDPLDAYERLARRLVEAACSQKHSRRCSPSVYSTDSSG